MTHGPFTATERASSPGLSILSIAVCLFFGVPNGTLGEATKPWLLRLTPSSPDAATHCNQNGRLFALPIAEGGEPAQFPVTPGKALRLDLDPLKDWQLSVDVPGCWAPDTALEPEASRSEYEVFLWRAGAVAAHLMLERHEQVPEALEVRLTPAPGQTDAERPPIVSITCPVKDMRFTCLLPAERLDLRIAAEDFIPEYRWNVEVPPGATRDLGEISLERGASLAGWVVTEGSLPDRPRVQVVPEVVGGSGTRTGERLSQRALSVETTDRGFFHVRGIAPGSYRLLAKATGHGAAERAPVVIGERREYVLEEPFVLEPLAEIAVSVDPPVGPTLQPWTIELRRQVPLSSMYRRVAEGTVDEDGNWSQEDLESGHYLVEILDSEGSSHFRQELDAKLDMRPLAVVLSLVPVRGRLKAGERPLSRTVWFEREDGTHIRMIADEDGNFEGVLPEEGRWKVRLEPTRGKGQRWLDEEVVVARARGEGWAHLDIELPATHLIGEVLDADRHPVGGALVSVYAPKRTLAQVYTRDDGSFAVHGLPTGELLARAEAKGNRESSLTLIELAADDDSDPIELIVRERRVFRGRVVLEGQPLAGARVHYRVPRSPLERTLQADPQGAFSMWLPAWVETVDLVVLAPGLPTKLTRIRIPPTGSRLPPIHLASVAGDLGIRFPDRQALYIRGEGDFIPIWTLFLPMDGGRLRGLDESTGILHLSLEPGNYTICPAPEESRRCEGGYLAPGGRLMLDLRRAALGEGREGREL